MVTEVIDIFAVDRVLEGLGLHLPSLQVDVVASRLRVGCGADVILLFCVLGSSQASRDHPYLEG